MVVALHYICNATKKHGCGITLYLNENVKYPFLEEFWVNNSDVECLFCVFEKRIHHHQVTNESLPSSSKFFYTCHTNQPVMMIDDININIKSNAILATDIKNPLH